MEENMRIILQMHFIQLQYIIRSWLKIQDLNVCAEINAYKFCYNQVRQHIWNEAGQLAGFIDNSHCGYYVYNGDGNRVYKLIGTTTIDQYNAGNLHANLYFDDDVLYVNPYMVVTQQGITKHYYNSDYLCNFTWITDSTGYSVQFLQNLSYGEVWHNQLNIGHYERFNFTCKDCDFEAGIIIT